MRERNVAVVNHLHNIIANDLSYIAMIANLQDGELWNRVRDKADEAFSSTHNIIRILDNNQYRHLSNPFLRISDIVDYEQDCLAAVGCDGICDCSEFDDEAISSGVRSVLADAIKEVFGNIRKHADYRSYYSLILKINSENGSNIPSVELLQSNVISSESTRYSTGKGLEMLRCELRDVNGEIHISNNRNVWKIHIVIMG